ncbi:YtxH domain-containing protein [Tellurirhabdus bombi]|uniref:YtxH domain-containing protein n=1 Tax=Tellurirhabdus bombi TaxID=2907205 RepID=UPI001F2942CB|nr:YtxH domain-containing protein [Tellurirhabdus bombi]
MKSNVSGIVVALLTGAALGILLAPRSGKATRKKFSSDTDKLLKDLQDSVSAGFDNIRHQYEGAKETVANRYNDVVDTAASKSKSAIEQAERNSKY